MYLVSNEFNYSLGLLTGTLIFPFALSALGLMFIRKRKYTPLIIVVVLDLLIALSRGIPFISVILLVLILMKPSRDYLRPQVAEDNTSVDDSAANQ